MISSETTSLARTRFNWILLVAVNIGVLITTIWEYHAGTDRLVVLVSGGISLVAGNSIVLMAFRKRYHQDGKRLPKSLLVGATTFAVICSLLTVFGISKVSHHNEYLDLALSDTPLSRIEPEQKRLVVELIRQTEANSQEEDKEMAELQKNSINPPVYSPESFANKQVMESTVAQVARYAEVDSQYYGKQQAAREQFRQKMASVDPSYLASWNTKRQDQEAIEKTTILMERDWLAGLELLYDYAAQHVQEISVKDGKIVIPSDSVRKAFNEQLDRSKALHDKLVSSVQEQSQRQQELKRSVGW